MIELTHQPINRHIGPQSIQESPHVWRREREGAIPHEDSWRSTLDLTWSPPLVKDLSDPINLLQIWLILIKASKNPLIYDFWFAPLFINLLIKIINNWFFGVFWPKWWKITQNLKKVGPWVYMVLLAWKWAPTWLKVIIWPTFITKSIFPIKLLKNSLRFLEKLNFNKKHWKK